MKVLLAVSGGVDSMYMLHRARELFPGDGIAAAHCNFGLRGAESDGDEEFVRRECSAMGVELFVKRFDTAACASTDGISIEMAARNLRYGWFKELCASHGFDALATAHNANDNAETLILNLLRGTGTKGLRGIEASRDLWPAVSPASAPVLLRPLLRTGREEIRKWMEDNGFAWREDSTNAEDEARRNKIRLNVFPVFAEINPSFVRTLGEDMARIRQTDDIADDYFKAALPSLVQQEGETLLIGVKPLLELKHWRYVLWRILEDCAFSAGTFDKLCALLERYSSEPPGTVTLSGKVFESPTFELRAQRRKLVLRRRGFRD